MPICHYGGSGVLKNLVRRFYKLVIARPKAEAIQELNIQSTFVGCNVDKILKQVQDDINRHSEGAARRISFDKRSFANAQDDNVTSLCKDDMSRHCEELATKQSTKLKCILLDCFANAQNDKKKAAFTLAEVLITLGIIGIVAAMTLPTVLSNVQDKVLESEAKKAANIVANGYKLMMAHDEIFKVENIPFLSNCNEMEDIDCVSKAHKESFSIVADSAGTLSAEEMPDSYAISGKSQPSPFKWSDTKYMYTTGDGMIFGVIPDETTWSSFDVIVDVNGKNNPNVAIKDLHKYRFSGEGGQLYDVTDELEQTSECSANNPSACTTRQQCNSIDEECRALGYDGSAFFDDTGCYCGYDPK